mgnify:CR=1 FL=1
MKILYIEDQKDIAIPVIKVFKKKGYIVDYSENGSEGLDMALVNNYDCIVLDLNLPGIDGIEISKKIKSEKPNSNILMLTARTSLDNKITGFQSGADDYLTKPFEILELIARINAVVRRNSINNSIELKLGDLILNPEKNCLMDNNKNEIYLSNKEAGVLEYLIRNKGRVISSEELLEHVWDTNANIFTETVKTHIKTIRKKLGRDSELIKTIKGKGYIYE